MTLNEQEIRKIAEEAVRQLGKDATEEKIEQVVREAAERVAREEPGAVSRQTTPINQTHNRIIITAFGRNRIGILAGLTAILAEHQCDILDLSQKILQEFFTIMLLVDISNCNMSFEEIKQEVVRRGEDLDLKVIVQHEDIFNAMHRI